MRALKFEKIYYTRIIANGFLLIVPISFGYVLIDILRLLFLENTIFSFFFIDWLTIPLYFLTWYMIALSILSAIELKIPDSLSRVFLYFLGVACINGFLFIINEIMPLYFINFLYGINQFEHYILLLVEIVLITVISFNVLSALITRNIRYISNKVSLGNQKGNSTTYSLYSKLKFTNESLLRKKVFYLGIIPYISLALTIRNSVELMEMSILILNIHFFSLLIYTLLVIFPKITLEKEFNMEEMIISRVNIYHYFLNKSIFLLGSILFPICLASVTIITFSKGVYISHLIEIIFILIIRTFYFVSLIVFLWRFLPSKNILQTSLLSIFGFEIVGFLVASFIFPAAYFVYSPILSSLTLSQLVLDPNVTVYLQTTVIMNLMFLISFYLSSLVLIKADIRYN